MNQETKNKINKELQELRACAASMVNADEVYLIKELIDKKISNIKSIVESDKS